LWRNLTSTVALNFQELFPMPSFDPQQYGPVVASLLDPQQFPELGPGKPNQAAYTQLRDLTPETLFPGQSLQDRTMAQCCLAGLWLEHNFLEESHKLSQAISSVAGSYWHGIMHRREPDFSNAKYWFRRVGDHPIFEPLAISAKRMAEKENLDSAATFLVKQERWDPYRFIDLCEAALDRKTANVDLCRRIAREEWLLLFDHCYRRAIEPAR